MKLATSEMEAETDRWRENGGGGGGGGGANGSSSGGAVLEENNDIVKRAKNMSSMAFSMYQFTKGEGALRTTQDLFTQAEYFAEEANRLYKVVRQFSYQVSVYIIAVSTMLPTRWKIPKSAVSVSNLKKLVVLVLAGDFLEILLIILTSSFLNR